MYFSKTIIIMDHINKINSYFKKCFDGAKSFELARKTSDIPSRVSDLITKLIPQELSDYLKSANYKVGGSVGKGFRAETPWIAILDKEITKTATEGVYIVFLFSSNYKNVYVTLIQGTSKLKYNQIVKNRIEVRNLLKINNPILNMDNRLDVFNDGYKAGTIYYTLWNVDNDEQCKNVLDLYLDVYRQYKNYSMKKDMKTETAETEIKSDEKYLLLPLQTIFYGTPGSGKSHKVKELVKDIKEEFVFRTTFHPDSDYASFVGCYKPKMVSVKNYHVKKTLDELKEEAKDITSQPAGNKVSQIIEFVTKYATLLPIIVEEYDEVQSMQNLLNKHLGFANETYLTYIVDYVNANQKQESKISYEFTPQAFTKAYVKAWKTREPVYLIIEEINRGNCAQIFGDLFQLLDRKDGVSEYPIDADNDLKYYLEREDVLGVGHAGIANGKLRLPSNLNILATMNTSDQSLFPMDSAFKRRWSWQCVPIEYEEKKRDGYKNESYYFTINIDNNSYSWIDFLKKTNDRIYKATDSEDKQMGNFFITHDVDEDEFVDKVMFYLWNDVCKEEVRTKNNFFRNYIDDKKQEEKEFSFNDLFKNNRTELLLKFMEYIGVEPKETKQQTAESESEK